MADINPLTGFEFGTRQDDYAMGAIRNAKAKDDAYNQAKGASQANKQGQTVAQALAQQTQAGEYIAKQKDMALQALYNNQGGMAPVQTEAQNNANKAILNDVYNMTAGGQTGAGSHGPGLALPSQSTMAGHTAFGTGNPNSAFSTPKMPVTATTPPPVWSPKGPVDYSAGSKLESSLKNSLRGALPRNLERGFRLDKPSKGTSAFS